MDTVTEEEPYGGTSTDSGRSEFGEDVGPPGQKRRNGASPDTEGAEKEGDLTNADEPSSGEPNWDSI